jgi:ATP-dependent 26S proteasome regulatory subunit
MAKAAKAVEIQRTMLELLNQLDKFESTKKDECSGQWVPF